MGGRGQGSPHLPPDMPAKPVRSSRHESSRQELRTVRLGNAVDRCQQHCSAQVWPERPLARRCSASSSRWWTYEVRERRHTLDVAVLLRLDERQFDIVETTCGCESFRQRGSSSRKQRLSPKFKPPMRFYRPGRCGSDSRRVRATGSVVSTRGKVLGVGSL